MKTREIAMMSAAIIAVLFAGYFAGKSETKDEARNERRKLYETCIEKNSDKTVWDACAECRYLLPVGEMPVNAKNLKQ